MSTLSVYAHSACSVKICQLGFHSSAQHNLSTQVQSVSSVVYNLLICDLSSLAAVCQLSSNADCQLGRIPFNHPESVSLTASCQLDCTMAN